MKIRILGSGTSSGVPRIGGDWGACDPGDPRNRRTRVSALVETATTRILIDTGPDMRQQLLDADVRDVDAVLWTHDHADHCHGIDDLRQLFHLRGQPVRGYARPETLAVLRERFGYAFFGRNGYRATVQAEELPDRLRIGDIDVSATDQPHGHIHSAGLRFDSGGRSIVYATDFNVVTDAMVALYRGCDLMVVDALREAPHPTHPTVSEALALVSACGDPRSVLIHMDHSMDYATVKARLPEHVEPGYDGLELVA
ncbi:MBL fold metallo-hydrolase [Sphingomonas sp. ac-8]|uniref:MBL fold metallo-hydrolase n=1 Tax=Sphingomonas sp. ac-8 TaxID=3242977 RepID=UPI003A80EA1D